MKRMFQKLLMVLVLTAVSLSAKNLNLIAFKNLVPGQFQITGEDFSEKLVSALSASDSELTVKTPESEKRLLELKALALSGMTGFEGMEQALKTPFGADYIVYGTITGAKSTTFNSTKIYPLITIAMVEVESREMTFFSLAAPQKRKGDNIEQAADNLAKVIEAYTGLTSEEKSLRYDIDILELKRASLDGGAIRTYGVVGGLYAVGLPLLLVNLEGFTSFGAGALTWAASTSGFTLVYLFAKDVWKFGEYSYHLFWEKREYKKTTGQKFQSLLKD